MQEEATEILIETKVITFVTRLTLKALTLLVIMYVKHRLLLSIMMLYDIREKNIKVSKTEIIR
jgi:hypothetical protein